MHGPSGAACGSLYEAQAPAAPDWPVLTQRVETDVLVIGGGLTGLSTALHLARQGARTIVLEAHGPGWGASGRNGGQVNPGLKPPPDTVEADFGPEHGPRLVQLAWQEGPDLVFDLIERYGIACDAARGGTLRAATATGQLAALRTLEQQCQIRGWPVQWLDSAAVAARTGHNHYCGGLLDRRGGQVNPLAYTQGVAQAAVQEGASLFCYSPVLSLKRTGGRWRAQTRTGCVVAERVVLATNGYTDTLHSALRRSIVPVYSGIVASEPLPAPLQRAILHERESLYELGQITTYYRVDGTGRLLMGGRSFSHPAQGAVAFPYLVARAQKLWPALRTIGWTQGWNGQLAVTLDHYPHWHEPEPGLLAALGYNGRGVAMATLAGRELAAYLVQGGAPLFPLSPVRPIALHGFWRAGVAARILLGRVQDRLGLS